MKLTSNYNLKKPDGTDVINVEDFNENSDKIDLELNKVNSLLENCATKDGTLQTNLNANLLEGKHANDFAISNHNHNTIEISDTIAASKPPSQIPFGFHWQPFYRNGYPCDYGDLITLKGSTSQSITQLVLEWKGSDATKGGLWIRNKRDCGDDKWSDFNRILTQEDYDKLFQYANNGKYAIANAIVGKGVLASNNDTFQELANKIIQIQTGGKSANGYISVGRNLKTKINIGFKANIVVGSSRRPNMVMVYLGDSNTYSGIRNFSDGELAGYIHVLNDSIEIGMENGNKLENFRWYAFE